MGIDVYMKWKGQTKAEEQAQYTGFSVEAGNVGYLREAYHGEPYATPFFVAEGFDDAKCEAHDGAPPIPAATLKERLVGAVFLALAREQIIYKVDAAAGIINMDAGDGTRTLAEAIGSAVADSAKVASGGGDGPAIAANMTDEQRKAVADLIEAGTLPPYAKAYVDFAALAETKERETGEPVRVYVSA